MTQPSATRPRWLAEAKDVVGACPVPHHEPPAADPAQTHRRRDRVGDRRWAAWVFADPTAGRRVVLLADAGAGRGVGRRRAGVRARCTWAAFGSAGATSARVITGTAVGLLLGAVFIVGGLIARRFPPCANTSLAYWNSLITGRCYWSRSSRSSTAWPRRCSSAVRCTPRWAGFTRCWFRRCSTSSRRRATTGNPMLGFAAIILGTVCALERRVTGGVLAPMLTHFFWGLVMVLALPPMFGV